MLIHYPLLQSRFIVVESTDPIQSVTSEIKHTKANWIVIRNPDRDDATVPYIGVIRLDDHSKPFSDVPDKQPVIDIPFQRVQTVTIKDLYEGHLNLSFPMVVVDAENEVVGIVPAEQIPQLLLEQLRIMQSFFVTLLDSVNDAVTCVDQEGTVLYWNRVAEEVYDVPRSEIVGKRIGDFFAQGSIMLFKILDEGRPIRQVYHHPRPDKHVLINASPIYTDDRLVGAIATEQDISRIVKMNEELIDLRSSDSLAVEETADPFHRIKGCSHALLQAVETARQVAHLPVPILIAGERGNGKRLLAETIHAARFSGGGEHPFITLNIRMYPPSVLESELFGFQANAFGGESQAKPGKIEQASEGTLVLDEAEALPLDIQLKLAEILERGELYRIGGQEAIPLRSRLIFLTNTSLEELYKQGLLREELYYQLNRVCITIPPLRERTEDILELTPYFLQLFAKQYHKPVPTLAPEVIAAFTTYDWPGNVRELRNTLERLVIFYVEGPITVDQLPSSMRVMTLDHLEQDHKHPSIPESADKPIALQDVERLAIVSALRKTAGNKAAAAKELGISRATLYAKLRQFQIDETSE
jgi:sigma-54 dependent transcriptional regulator, acetoin dehydrogenase operon transcriptional activator AcoR